MPLNPIILVDIFDVMPLVHMSQCSYNIDHYPDRTDKPDGWGIIATPKDEALSTKLGYNVAKQW